MRLRLPIPLLAALLAVFLLSACVPAALLPAESANAAGGGTVIVVGRVVLDPPLHPKEQRLSPLSLHEVSNRMFLLTSRDQPTLDDTPGMSDLKERIEATLGETFFVKAKAEPTYFRAGLLFLNDNRSADYQALFPGGLRIKIRPDDQAIYIGTIEYRRDEAFNVLGARIVDEYSAAQREFEQKFGRKIRLRKALLAKS